MKHLGDITKIDGAEIEPVDCITFGSPCQDLSVAGKRAGLDGARSGLFSEAVRVIREMREATNGLYPTFAVWENVPGAFSSNGGEDFRAVLEQLARVARPGIAIPRPEGGRWRHAGYIAGDGFSIAWRLLDAQYWGVPQRRKRIALVVDFGGQRAGEILFERESLRGDTAQSCPPWQGIARAPENRAGTDDRTEQCFDGRGNGDGTTAPAMTGNHNGRTSDYTALIAEKTAGTLTGRYDGSPNGDGNTPLVCEVAGFSFGQSAKARSIGYEAQRSPTLRGGEGGNQRPCVIYGIGSYDSGGMKSSNPHAGIYEAETSRSLDAAGGANPARNQGGMAVCEVVSHTLKAKANTDNRADSETYIACHATAQANAETLENQSPTLNCDHEQPIAAYPINTMVGTRGNEETRTCFGVGDAQDPQFTLSGAHCHAVGYDARERWTVRRLTPLECERLQGYPDNWTDIGEWVDTKGKRHKPADTPRYKTLGNSIALPQWWWLTCKMAEHLPERATLGSLFDGIGGFPLVWETRHGKGTAIWASEIEEFCIAVTKRRFENENGDMLCYAGDCQRVADAQQG